MKVVVASIGNLSNRGVQALAMSTKLGLEQTFPGAEVVFINSNGLANAEAMTQIDCSPISDPFGTERYYLLRKLGILGKALTRIGGFPALDRFEAELDDCDLMVVSGGDNFGPEYGDFEVFAEPLKLAFAKRVPVALIGQSVSAFRTEAQIRTFTTIADNAAMIAVREKISFDYLAETFPQLGERLVETADTAYLMEPASAEWADLVLRHAGIPQDTPFVALSISGGINTFSSLDPDNHVQSWRAALLAILENCCPHILIVPHVTDPRTNNNDLHEIDRVLASIDYDPRVRVASPIHDAQQFKSLICRSELIIAERMHAAIAALSTCTPAAVIGYSVKGQGILESALGRPMDNDPLLVDAKNFTANTAKDFVIGAWNARDRARSDLAALIDENKLRARLNFSLLKKVVA